MMILMTETADSTAYTLRADALALWDIAFGNVIYAGSFTLILQPYNQQQKINRWEDLTSPPLPPLLNRICNHILEIYLAVIPLTPYHRYPTLLIAAYDRLDTGNPIWH
jgi:hypothetical protein